jgi:hypothetical protein
MAGQGGSARSTGQFRTTVRPRRPAPAGGEGVGDGVPAGAEATGAVVVGDAGCREMVRVDGFADGVPDPQAAGAMARTAAKTAINGRDGARGIPVGRSERRAGSGPPQ